MRQEVIEFWESIGKPVDKVLEIGISRRGLSSESLKKSLESVYDDIQSGMKIKENKEVWEVYKRSSLGGRDPQVSEALNRIEERLKKIEHDVQPWWKRWFR